MFDLNKIDSKGICRQSVNWKYDDGAVDFTIYQLNESDGTYKHKGGVVAIRTEELDYVKNNPRLDGDFDYKRDPEYYEDGSVKNEYHGNLILANIRDYEKRDLRLLAEQLALFANLTCDGPEDD